MLIKADKLQKFFRMYSYDFMLDGTDEVSLEINDNKLYITLKDNPDTGFFIEGSKHE